MQTLSHFDFQHFLLHCYCSLMNFFFNCFYLFYYYFYFDQLFPFFLAFDDFAVNLHLAIIFNLIHQITK
jgi:hypothetical protein